MKYSFSRNFHHFPFHPGSFTINGNCDTLSIIKINNNSQELFMEILPHLCIIIEIKRCNLNLFYLPSWSRVRKITYFLRLIKALHTSILVHFLH